MDKLQKEMRSKLTGISELAQSASVDIFHGNGANVTSKLYMIRSILNMLDEDNLELPT